MPSQCLFEILFAVQHQKLHSGFSLVELSIVLVILGLLIGGILAGQSLIRAAEIRSVVTDSSRYITATRAFQDKYFSLPGDMSNATMIWGKNTTYCNGATGSAGTPGTCNGDASGTVNYNSGANTSVEGFQFWNQLALAGLVEGNYTGIAGSGGGYHATSANTPRSKLTNAAWSIFHLGVMSGSSVFYTRSYGNVFEIGGYTSTSDPQAKALKPEEAWNIDTKADDGKPAYGKVIALYWNNECGAADNGTHANTNLVASYKLSDNSIQCALLFDQL